MNSSTKTVWYVIAALVVLGIIAFAMGRSDTSVSPADQTASTTGNVSRTGTGKSGVTTTTTTTSTNNSTTAGLSDADVAMMIASAKISVPQTGVDVALTNGGADFTDSSVSGHISSGPVLSKVQTDNGMDVFTDMTITKKGQPQILHYLAAFHVVGTTVSYTSAVLIGDRLTLLGAVASKGSAYTSPASSPLKSTDPYTLTLNYLDRKNGEPLTTTPSVAKTVSLRVLQHRVSK